MPTDNPIRIETVFQSMHTSLMKQVVEETCPRHGLYRSYVTILGGQEVGHTGCPECARLEKIADEKAALEELQRQVAAEEARKAEEALRRARVPSAFKGKTLAGAGALEALCGSLGHRQRKGLWAFFLRKPRHRKIPSCLLDHSTPFAGHFWALCSRLRHHRVCQVMLGWKKRPERF